MNPSSPRTRRMILFVPSMVFATAGVIVIYSAQYPAQQNSVPATLILRLTSPVGGRKIPTSGESISRLITPSPKLSQRRHFPLPRINITRDNFWAHFCSSIRPSP